MVCTCVCTCYRRSVNCACVNCVWIACTFTGHKYYGVKRRRLFIDSIDNIVYKNDNDYEKYKQKILSLTQNNNINEFAIQLFVKPSIIISMFVKEHERDILLLYSICQSDNTKMILLFLDCLQHFGEIILGQKYNNNNDDSNLFFKKYFNFNQCEGMSYTTRFVK